MKTIQLLILLMVATLSMQSCRKDGDIFEVTPPTPELGMNVQGSVMGTVIDENGEAVQDAIVTLGNLIESTDQYGVFQFKDQTLHSGGTYVKVEKDGFFHGSRKFYPTNGTTSRVNIELMTMEEVASFSSSAGEKIEFEGVEIDFGTNSIMREDGSAYDGNVVVFAKYLDPTLLATLNQMPGDLTAINENDERVSLTSYGMVTVELRDDTGNKLQVKTGSMADITMPIPAEIAGSAPTTIPLWHFDEELGTWIEEGEATLSNGEYVGQVSHFSFWNCDVPSELIHLSGTILNRGIPVSGVLVKITLENDNASGSGLTNNDGEFGGFVPKDEVLVIEIFDHCGSLIYTTTVGPFNENTVLDPYNLLITTQQAIVSGSVTSCDVLPSDATYVVIVQSDFNIIIPVNSDYTFQTNIFYCEEGDEIIIAAEDPINQIASSNSTFTVEGNVDAGVLELCEESLSNYLVYQYGEEEFLYTELSQDSLVFMGASYQVFNQTGQPDLVIYNITVINWNTAGALDYELRYIEGSPMQNVTMPVPFAGFNASGMATIQLVSQGGESYIRATGTLLDVEITDNSLYDESYNSLFFSSTTRLW